MAGSLLLVEMSSPRSSDPPPSRPDLLPSEFTRNVEVTECQEVRGAACPRSYCEGGTEKRIFELKSVCSRMAGSLLLVEI